MIGKLNKKSFILTFGQFWPLGHTGQVNLTTSNLTSGFFIEHKMVFLIGQLGQKIGQPKIIIKKPIFLLLINK